MSLLTSSIVKDFNVRGGAVFFCLYIIYQFLLSNKNTFFFLFLVRSSEHFNWGARRRWGISRKPQPTDVTMAYAEVCSHMLVKCHPFSAIKILQPPPVTAIISPYPKLPLPLQDLPLLAASSPLVTAFLLSFLRQAEVSQ